MYDKFNRHSQIKFLNQKIKEENINNLDGKQIVLLKIQSILN